MQNPECMSNMSQGIINNSYLDTYLASFDTDPTDLECAYVGNYNASCGASPGLWANGESVFERGNTFTFLPGFGGPGGGMGSGPLSGDYGVGLPPLGSASGPPCDFGTCGSGYEGAAVATGGFIIRTTTWACGLNPVACVAGGLILGDVGLLG